MIHPAPTPRPVNIGLVIEAGTAMLGSKHFGNAERMKCLGVCRANMADRAKLQTLVDRILAEVAKRVTPEEKAAAAERTAKQDAERAERQKEYSKQAAIAQTCGVMATVIAAAHTAETGEPVAVATLAAVMNPNFLYSKQRPDGGCTIYRRSNGPSGVESCGAGTPAQIALAGRLLKRNAYIGQQFENLRSSAGY